MKTEPIKYMQTDSKWANISYSAPGESTTIGKAGCGPTCMAMVIASIKDSKITPKETAAWSLKNGYKAKNQGTYYTYFAPQGKVYGINCGQLNGANIQGLSASSAKSFHDLALAEIKNGNLVICCMGKGNWTSSGHFILWYGINGDKVLIHDPNSTAAVRVKADLSLLQKQVKYYFPVKVPQELKKGDDEVVTTAEMKVNGKMVKVNRILKDGANYIQLNDLKMLGVINTSYDVNTKMVTIDSKK